MWPVYVITYVNVCVLPCCLVFTVRSQCRLQGFLLECVLHRRQEAQLAYEEAVRIDPKHVRSWYYLGILKKNQRDTNGAEQAFRNAAEFSNFSHVNSMKDLGNLLVRRMCRLFARLATCSHLFFLFFF